MSLDLTDIASQLTAAQTAALNAFDALDDMREAFEAVEADHEVFDTFNRVRELMAIETAKMLGSIDHVNSITQRCLELTREAIEQT